MTKRAGAALLLAAAALFLIANRAAYRGYFQDDELNNISWTRDIAALDYAKAVLTPKFFNNNFRPVGHFYYRQMALWFGLDFPKYLPIMHLAHVLNIWLVWLLARRLGIGALAASLGTLFFVFDLAVFEVYWKPMYVFDLFCATFTLTSVLLYTHRRYVLSFLAFWLAYKSKELAVMIPVALACYEFWLAERRNWKPLIPFFAVSLSFGLQGVLMNPNVDNDYTFRFTVTALQTSLTYYASKILLIPYAGLALLAVPLLVHDRRVWFGCAMLCLFFVPLMFLPGRLFPAYCYLPLAGLSLMTAALADRKNLLPVVAIACAAWIPWNLLTIRKTWRETLATDNENRVYVSALADFARASKNTHTFVYDGAPAGLHAWGIEGALRFLYRRPPGLYSIEDKEAAQALKLEDVALLNWNPATRTLAVLSSKMKTPYVAMNLATPLWQFGGGWYSQEEGFRWMAPHASATLTRPGGAREFELIVNVSPEQIQQTGPIGVAVSLDGTEIGTRKLSANGVQTSRWPTPPSNPGQVRVDIDVTPEYRPSNGDTRRLGVAVVAFGFR
jgi:hypothetical protein